MAVIHENQRTVSFKIVYGGPPLGGKTTNVQHIHSCLDPDTRTDLVSLNSAADRTLFFDFLAIEAPLPNGYRAKFQLYTVPGQIIYNATYQLVLRQADGLVFVADSQMDRMVDNLQAWETLQNNLKRNGQSLDRIPLVLQYNKRDLPNVAPLEYLEYLFNQGERRFPSFEASAFHGQNVLSTLNSVSHAVLSRFNAIVEEGRLPSDGQFDTSNSRETVTV